MTEIKARGRRVSEKPRSSLFKKKVVDKKEPEVVEEIKNDIPEPIIEEKKIVEPIIETKMSEQVDEFEVPSFDDYSPIAEPVVDRSYNHAEVIAEIGDISEPDFGDQVPTFDDFQDAEQPEVEQPKEPNAFDNISNPAMSDLDAKDKKMASTQLVNSVLEGYAMIHELGIKVAKIDEAKVYEKLINGEIDSELRVPIAEDGSSVNAQEYANTHNQQVVDALTYDPEFGEKVKPAMIRVFTKKGWGITDEQFLLGMFGKDLAMKMVMIIGMKKQGNEMLKHFATATASNRAEVVSQPPVQTYTPDSIQSKPKEEAPIVEMKVETAKMSVEDIEAQMMED
jgi:hypothetical protein